MHMVQKSLLTWPHVQSSTVGRRAQHEDDVKKHQQSRGSRLPKRFRNVLSWCQAQSYPKNFPPPYLLIGITALVIDSVPQNQSIKPSQVSVQHSVQKLNQLVVCFPFILGLKNIIDQYLHQPFKVSSQSQLLRVQMKQADLIEQGCHSLFNHTMLMPTS